MTGTKWEGRRINLKEVFSADQDSLKELLGQGLQEVLKREMTDHRGSEGGKESRAAGLSRGLLYPVIGDAGGET